MSVISKINSSAHQISFPNTTSKSNSAEDFSTTTVFWALHEKNLEYRANIRGSVNHRYNQLLEARGIKTLIPGGEDLERLGMDQTTTLVRPDLYFQAYREVLSTFKDESPLEINISTASFFNILQEENVKHNADLRGMIDHRYNQLIEEEPFYARVLPDATILILSDMENLSLDQKTPLNPERYFKAYSFVFSLVERQCTHKLSKSEESQYLNWTQRPLLTQFKIFNIFDKLSKQQLSGWGIYNGDSSYLMCDIDDRKLIKTIINQAAPTRKDFYFLDIGAGNFQWGEEIATFINREKDFHSDIVVHIINVRGESNEGEKVKTKGKCKIYNLGKFKIEELSEAFKDHELFLENKLDLIVSRYCFRHLVDPVGTFVQTYGLLRPETGLLLMDGFYFQLQNDDRPHEYTEKLMLDTKAPFLMKLHPVGRSTNHFIMRRPNANPCKLQMTYLGMEWANSGDYDIASQSVIKFRREAHEDDKRYSNMEALEYSTFRGDKALYNWLKKDGLLPLQGLSVFKWKPIHKEIDANAEASEKTFGDQVLYSIKEQQVNQPEFGCYNDMVDWYKKGDCVVLTNKEKDPLVYHQCASQKEQDKQEIEPMNNPRVIYLDFAPYLELLDSEVPLFMEKKGCQHCNCNLLKQVAESKNATTYHLRVFE